jgi:hypothetical protein
MLDFVGACLRRKFTGKTKHHTILHNQTGELIRRAVAQPEFHPHFRWTRTDACAESNAVGQGSLAFERLIFAPLPFKPRQGYTLFAPLSRSVCMCVSKINQPDIRENRFRNVDHNVTTIAPWSKNADLCLPLRIHRALEETQAWMTPSRVRQHTQPIARITLWNRPGIQAEFAQRRCDLINGQAGGSLDFAKVERMEYRHVFQPVTQLGFRRGRRYSSETLRVPDDDRISVDADTAASAREIPEGLEPAPRQSRFTRNRLLPPPD